jgi:cation:H+ antiporter
MITTILIMIISALIIYFSCELFVNGIEWVGKAFNISQSAVGSVLAAFGTALPESIVTFIAVVFGVNASQKDIGVGAALGGPLVLSTIGYAFIGICIIIFSGRRKMGSCINVNVQKLAKDQIWFMCIFVFKVGLGLVAFAIKPWLGFLFLIVYAVYFYREMSEDTVEVVGELEPLRFSPKSVNPKKLFIVIQTIISLIFIFIGSQLFVHNLDSLSITLGMPPRLVALLLSPIATELPEILNVFIWVKQGKENLAIANISGSMMIQATVPSALGIIFTPWILDKSLILSAVVTFVAILAIWITLKISCLSAKKLSLNVLLYGIFIIGFLIIKGSFF